MSVRVPDEKLREMETWVTRPEVASAAAELLLRRHVPRTWHCDYCEAGPFTTQALAFAHQVACADHPMRAVEKERDAARAERDAALAEMREFDVKPRPLREGDEWTIAGDGNDEGDGDDQPDRTIWGDYAFAVSECVHEEKERDEYRARATWRIIRVPIAPAKEAPSTAAVPESALAAILPGHSPGWELAQTEWVRGLERRLICLEVGHMWGPEDASPDGSPLTRECIRCERREVYVQPVAGGWQVQP